MTGFSHRDGVLHAEQLSAADLAARFGTPLYVYSAGAVRERVRAFRDAFAGMRVRLCYAVKANPNLAILRLVAAGGMGADTVSGGEIERALAAGVPAERIVFAGVAKTDEEIRLGIEAGILQFNVESREELERIAALAAAAGRVVPVAFRVNPDVAAPTHGKISTGRRGDKFGIAVDEIPEAVARARALPAVEPVGLHLHIGSQITTLDPLVEAWRRLRDLHLQLVAAGAPLRRLDLGGGFGVRYRDERPLDPGAVAEAARRLFDGLDVELVFEPGRAIVAEAGILLSRVIYRKESGGRRFLVVDAGMHTILRPALYDAWHEIVPVRLPRPDEPVFATDVVGPICESSDVLGRDRPLPLLERGELVAVLSAGAYGATMATDYNSRPRPAEVLVDGSRVAVVRPRREPRELFAGERIPEWLDGPRAEAGTAREEAP